MSTTGLPWREEVLQLRAYQRRWLYALRQLHKELPLELGEPFARVDGLDAMLMELLLRRSIQASVPEEWAKQLELWLESTAGEQLVGLFADSPLAQATGPFNADLTNAVYGLRKAGPEINSANSGSYELLWWALETTELLAVAADAASLTLDERRGARGGSG